MGAKGINIAESLKRSLHLAAPPEQELHSHFPVPLKALWSYRHSGGSSGTGDFNTALSSLRSLLHSHFLYRSFNQAIEFGRVLCLSLFACVVCACVRACVSVGIPLGSKLFVCKSALKKKKKDRRKLKTNMLKASALLVPGLAQLHRDRALSHITGQELVTTAAAASSPCRIHHDTAFPL